MPPKTEIWTSERENRLIFEVERRPMLWDVSCEAYKRADLKYNQWHQIAQILGPFFNADMVQHRFTSMKHTFMTNLRKERESKRRCSGKSPEEIYKPKWVMYDKLKFLTKSCIQAESSSNLQMPLNISHSDKTELLTDNIATKETTEFYENIEYLEDDVVDTAQLYLHDTQKLYIPTDVPKHEIYINSDSFSASTSVSSCSSTNNLSSLLPSYDESQLSSSSGLLPAVKQPATVHSSASLKSANLKSTCNKENMYIKRGTAKRRKESVAEEALEVIKAMNQPTSENDSAEYFGVFIAARLREMNSQSRKQCEHEIMKCLANY
ncbi:uncharacterized protein LOC105198956 [Solenopsis invicta]|nr:uncharacterized protein LOC105198956 [Solenopsis invicta]